jgi:hypothetical protein
MSRDYGPDDPFDPREAAPAPTRSTDRPEQSRAETSLGTKGEVSAPEQDRLAPARQISRERTPPAERRKRYEIREQTYRLRSSEIRTLIELGRFRIVATRDLRRILYPQERDRMKRELANLLRQGLIADKLVPHEETPPRQLLALTKSGYQFLAGTGLVPKDQALYYGFTRPREALHDADLYRLYQKAAQDIEERGGKNLHVVLEYELEKRVYQDLAESGPDENSIDLKRLVAEQHGLQVVCGKIPFPDLRIEYETRDGEMARVDFELATAHYRGGSVAEKVLAGFSIYADAQDAPGLRRILDQRELTAEILSL